MRLPVKLKLFISIIVALRVETLNNNNFKFHTNAEEITTFDEHHWNLQNEFSDDTAPDDERILREICPANFCTYNDTDEYALDAIEQNKMCCIPCDCSDECFELGNCCYGKDSSNKRPRDEELELCTQTFIVNSFLRTESIRLSFMLYQHCNDTENAALVQKCRAEREVDLSEYIPVYSLHTGRHYRNKYCAICNKDHENLTDWVQELRCDSYTDMLSLLNNETNPNTNIIQRLKDGTTSCNFYVKPPENIHVTKCIHPRDIISMCASFSQSYGQYDKKCRTFHAPVVHKGSVYKNVFCLMCNDPLVYFEESDCFVNGTKDQYFPSQSFMALLTFNEAGLLNLVNKNSSDSKFCNPPAVINEEINACITARCPLTMMRAGNQCYKVLSTLKYVNLDFRVDVIHPVSDEYDDVRIFNEVLTLITYSSYFVCDFSVINRDLVGENIQIKALLKINVLDEIDLEDEFKSFVNNINIYNTNPSNILKMKVGNGPLLIPPIGNSFTLPSYEDKNDSSEKKCVSIAMSEIIFCPLVMLNEYTNVSDDTICVDTMIFKEGEFVMFSGSGHHPSIYVCMNSYIQRYKKSRRERTFQVCTNGYQQQFPVILYLACLNIFALAFAKHDKCS